MHGQILEFAYMQVGKAGAARITGKYQVVQETTGEYQSVVVGKIIKTANGYVVVSESGQAPLESYLNYKPKYLN